MCDWARVGLQVNGALYAKNNNKLKMKATLSIEVDGLRSSVVMLPPEKCCNAFSKMSATLTFEPMTLKMS